MFKPMESAKEEEAFKTKVNGRWTDDCQKVITIAHLVSLRLSGELKAN